MARSIAPLALFMITVFSLNTGQVLGEEVTITAENNQPEYSLQLHDRDGLLSVEAENVPLETLLLQLSQKEKVRFKIPASASLKEVLSISLRDLTLPEMIARVLRGYNYITEEGFEDGLTIVTIVGMGPILSSAHQVDVHKVDRNITQSNVKRPSNLDECVKLALSDQNTSSDLKEAKLIRAQKVLSMDRCSHLSGQAMMELADLRDDRATALLEKMSKTGQTVDLRVKAVEALWRSVAKSGFKDRSGIEALKKLAGSSEEVVRSIAEKALEDTERHTNAMGSQ